MCTALFLEKDSKLCVSHKLLEWRIRMSDLLQVGVITATHGLKGEVKVFPTTDDVKRFKKLKECILDTGKEQLTLELEGCRFFKQFVILKFKGIDNINDVEKYKKCSLFVTREHAVKLKKDEFFITDLINLTVKNEAGEEIGIIKEVLSTGANDVYVIEKKEGGELLLPALKQCVKKVDFEEKCMIVQLMNGLE